LYDSLAAYKTIVNISSDLAAITEAQTKIDSINQ
jgi:hypothetical protein